MKNNKQTNLNMIQPIKETVDILLSKTKSCETPIKQTHRKAEETLKFKLTKSKEFFSVTPSVNLGPDSNPVFGLLSLKVCNSI